MLIRPDQQPKTRGGKPPGAREGRNAPPLRWGQHVEIKVVASKRVFYAPLHFAVVQGDYLMAASFGGLESTVRAISASVIEGRPVELGDVYNRQDFKTEKGSYRKVERKSGDIFHGFVLHKAAVFEENSECPLILAQDGDVERAVGQYLSARYTLPVVWMSEYAKMLPRRAMEELRVILNPHSQRWRNLRAIRMSSAVTEESVLEAIGKRLKSGQLIIPQLPSGPKGKFNPDWDMQTYLRENATILAQKLDSVPPRHDPAKDKLDPAIANMGRIPFPAQAYMIQALVNTLREQNSTFCSGDMGTGKSTVANGVIHLLHERKSNMRVLLVAPGITVPKWQRQEIAEALPYARVRVLNSTAEALRFLREARLVRPRGLEIVLVGTDRAKLGPEPWCSAIWKRVAGSKFYAWHCPDCGSVLPDPDADEEDMAAGWEVLAHDAEPIISGQRLTPNGLPVGFPVSWRIHGKLKKCPACRAKLWRPALKSRGETKNGPRWFISRILKKMRGQFELFIQDEVHQVKAQDSGRGDAFAQMIKAAKKTLALTGTLVNGKSTSIKEILWRTDPGALLADGFNHESGMVQWATRYGVLNQIEKVEDVDTGVVTRQKRTVYQPREGPGISPQLTAHHLLHKAAFMELSDLGLPLVELKEIPFFIQMDKEHAKLYKRFHENLHSACRAASMNKERGAWAKFTPATVNYADRPDLGATVIIGDEEEQVIISAPPIQGFHAKERYLVELVQKELAEGRGVIIYCNYTDNYEAHHRVRDVLKAHGIECSVLESSVPPQSRVEWLARKEAEGERVLVTNMRLVEVGLDLLPWQSMVFYQLTQGDINTVRQASRRAWRIGQSRECRVYYLVYDGTQQVAQFEDLMVKRSHAMLVEGRLDRSELAKYGRDAHTALAMDLANCLASSELADKWKELARKDIDQKLKIVSEADFREAIAKSQKDLVEETLRLCGKTAQVRMTESGRLGLLKAEVRIVETLEPIKVGRKKIIPAGQLAFDWGNAG